ncbi:hypothetical protein E3A20_26810, partial [Planctomyces bekefii]
MLRASSAYLRLWIIVAATLLAACNTTEHPSAENQLQSESAPQDSELSQAVKANQNQQIVSLLVAGHSPNELNSAGMGPLHYAAARRNIEAVRILLDAGANINADPSTDFPSAIHMAAQGGSLEILQLLIHKGADINTIWFLNGHTALYEATFQVRPEVVEFLLANGADTAAVNVRGLS